MKNKPADLQRLQHIVNSIDEVNSYTVTSNFDSFIKNSMMKHACISQLQIIGEAANHVSDNVKSKNPDMNWQEIISMRHILIHEYYGVVDSILWQTIKEDLPRLKVQIQQIIDNLPPAAI